MKCVEELQTRNVQLTLKIRLAKHNSSTFVVVQKQPATEPMTLRRAQHRF